MKKTKTKYKYHPASKEFDTQTYLFTLNKTNQ